MKDLERVVVGNLFGFRESAVRVAYRAAERSGKSAQMQLDSALCLLVSTTHLPDYTIP